MPVKKNWQCPLKNIGNAQLKENGNWLQNNLLDPLPNSYARGWVKSYPLGMFTFQKFGFKIFVFILSPFRAFSADFSADFYSTWWFIVVIGECRLGFLCVCFHGRGKRKSGERWVTQ